MNEEKSGQNRVGDRGKNLQKNGKYLRFEKWIFRNVYH
jgi:hypothetical protein